MIASIFAFIIIAFASACEVTELCSNCKCDQDTAVQDGIRVSSVEECIEYLGADDQFFSLRDDVYCVAHVECPEEDRIYNTQFDWTLYAAECQPEPDCAEFVESEYHCAGQYNAGTILGISLEECHTMCEEMGDCTALLYDHDSEDCRLSTTCVEEFSSNSSDRWDAFYKHPCDHIMNEVYVPSYETIDGFCHNELDEADDDLGCMYDVDGIVSCAIACGDVPGRGCEGFDFEETVDGNYCCLKRTCDGDIGESGPGHRLQRGEFNAWMHDSAEWGAAIWCVFEEDDLSLFYCFDSPYSDCWYGEGSIIWHECYDACDDTLCPGLNSIIDSSTSTPSPTEPVITTTSQPPALSNEKCFIEECGCPGSFVQPWCTRTTAVMDSAYCQQSSAACGQCSGVWCPESTTTSTTTTPSTSIPTSLPSASPSRDVSEPSLEATLPSQDTTLQIDAAFVAEKELGILDHALFLPAAFGIIVVCLCVTCFWIRSSYKYKLKVKKMKYEANDAVSNAAQADEAVLNVAPESTNFDDIATPSEGIMQIEKVPTIGEATWRATMLDVSEFSPMTRYGGSEVSLTESEGSCSLYDQGVSRMPHGTTQEGEPERPTTL